MGQLVKFGEALELMRAGGRVGRMVWMDGTYMILKKEPVPRGSETWIFTIYWGGHDGNTEHTTALSADLIVADDWLLLA